MTTITLDLPEDIAEQARREGLLEPRALRDLIEEATRITAMKRLQGMWRATPASERNVPPPSADELQALIREVRRQRLG